MEKEITYLVKTLQIQETGSNLDISSNLLQGTFKRTRGLQIQTGCVGVKSQGRKKDI